VAAVATAAPELRAAKANRAGRAALVEPAGRSTGWAEQAEQAAKAEPVVPEQQVARAEKVDVAETFTGARTGTKLALAERGEPADSAAPVVPADWVAWVA
jgi:hypothetical protein